MFITSILREEIPSQYQIFLQKVTAISHEIKNNTENVVVRLINLYKKINPKHEINALSHLSINFNILWFIHASF